MPVFKLVLEYDGAGFEGWQRQPEGHRTVQATLESVLAGIVGAPVTIAGAGRTDAGVHAEGQVAAAVLDTRLSAAVLARALNARLPDDVAVTSAEPAADGFDPRREARWKHYRYQLWNDRRRSPLRAQRWHHVPVSLDRGALTAAAQALEGTHDFASFQAAGTRIVDTQRTLHRVRILEAPQGTPGLVLDFVGSGFLRHMVRIMVGTLIEVGRGRFVPEGMPPLLESRDRTRAGPTAPAHGLTLMSVQYTPDPGEPPVPSGS